MTTLRTAVFLLGLAAAMPAQDAPPSEHKKDLEATQATSAPGSEDILWLNPLKWTPVASGREDTAVYFHQTGAAQARLIVTHEGKTPEAQLEDTVARIRKLDPEAEVAFEEKRTVNGSPMLCIQIVVDGGDQGEILYYGYLFGNDSRSVQLFTVAPRAAMTELYVDLTSLLNGLEIREKTPTP